MKGLSLILLIITSFVTIKAQDYKQFPTSNENPLWVIKTTNSYFDDNVNCSYLGMIGDTAIGSNEYSRIYYLSDTIVDLKYISGYYGALREDSKKIYLIYANDQKEKLVLDFNKEINDTVLFVNTTTPPTPILLENIDTITLNGLTFSRYSTSCGDRWIEGIGNTEWSTFETCPPIPENGTYTKLYSFKLGGTIIYGKNCNCINTSSKLVVNNGGASLKIYPNPANNHIKIEYDSSIGIRNNIQIIDLTGKIVFETPYTKNNTIALDDFDNGVYLIRLLSDNFIFSNSLIIHKNNKIR